MYLYINMVFSLGNSVILQLPRKSKQLFSTKNLFDFKDNFYQFLHNYQVFRQKRPNDQEKMPYLYIPFCSLFYADSKYIYIWQLFFTMRVF